MDEQNEPIEVLPWERQDGEPPKHYEWFHVYLLMGPGRSLLGSYKKFYPESQKVSKSLNVSPGWRDAFTKWKWLERAHAWDDEQRVKRERQVDEDKRAIYSELLSAGRDILKQAKSMGNFPLVETELDGGKTIIKPAKWSRDTIAKTVTTATKAFKEAFELEDKRVTGGVRNLSEEELILQSKAALEALGYIILSPQEDDDAEDDSATD